MRVPSSRFPTLVGELPTQCGRSGANATTARQTFDQTSIFWEVFRIERINFPAGATFSRRIHFTYGYLVNLTRLTLPVMLLREVMISHFVSFCLAALNVEPFRAVFLFPVKQKSRDPLYPGPHSRQRFAGDYLNLRNQRG
jgi:hypothetical protein